MKWNEFYSGLSICEQSDQSDRNVSDYFVRMASAEMFAFYPTRIIYDRGEVSAVLRCPQNLYVHIIQVSTDLLTNVEEVKIIFKTVGILPLGFVHGTYTLCFSKGKHSKGEHLPSEMFEDCEVTEHKTQKWVEMDND